MTVSPTSTLPATFGPGPSRAPRPVDEDHFRRIDGLLDEMDRRFRRLHAARDPGAVFARAYFIITRTTRAYLEKGYFDDGNFMIRLQIAFARRYFEAIDAFTRGEGEVAAPWRVTFEWGRSGESAVVEDLVMGINVHIGYDLGIAAWETRSVEENRSDDFFRVNDILVEAVRHINEELRRAFDPTFHLDEAGSGIIFAWRKRAWANAEALTAAAEEARAAYLARMSEIVTGQIRRLMIPKEAPTAPARLAYIEAHPLDDA